MLSFTYKFDTRKNRSAENYGTNDRSSWQRGPHGGGPAGPPPGGGPGGRR